MVNKIDSLSPTTKATVAVTIFSVASLIGLFLHIDSIKILLPSFIFYVLFLINSFYSIRLFFGIIPTNLVSQKIVDFILFIIYLILAFTIYSGFLFSLFLTIFFIFGTLKYVLLKKCLVGNSRLLFRKILANSLAALLGFLIMIGVLMGFEIVSAWSLVVIFSIANIYIFFINPLYRLDSSQL